MNLFQIASYISQGIQFAGKAANTVKAGIDIHEAATSTELTPSEKAHRIATSGLFIFAQTADLGTEAFHASPMIRLGTKIGAGVTDTARVISKKSLQDDLDSSDYLDIASTVAFRTADAGGFAANHFSGSYQYLKDPAEWTQAGGILIANRHSLYKTCKTITSWWNANRSTSSSSTSPPAEDNDIPKALREVLRSTEIKDFNQIPELFLNDEELCKWTCPITKKPIRYILVIDTTEQTDSPIFYERSAITKWIDDHPGETPPNWPFRVHVRKHRLVNSRVIQDKINMQLTTLLRDTHELLRTELFDT